MKNFLFLIITFAFCTIHAQVSLRDSLEDFSQRLRAVERDQQNVHDRFENQFTKLKQEQELKTDKFIQDHDFINRIALLALVLGIVGFPIGLGLIRKRSRKYAQQLVHETIAKEVRDQTETIIQLIKYNELETQLKRDKQILVICEDIESKAQMQQYFSKKYSFAQVVCIVFDPAASISLQSVSLVVIDDHSFKPTNSQPVRQYQDFAVTFRDIPKDICFVYYGARLNNPPPNFNFANSEFTLYARILETLKIQAARKA